MVDFGRSDTITTLSRMLASLRLASEQVSSRFRAGLGPDSIMNFGLKHIYALNRTQNTHDKKETI